MMLIKRVLFPILWFVLANTGFGQTTPALKPVTNAKTFQIRERALLILDQDLYLAGERINFFALTYDAALRIPVDLSSVLYVELFGQENNVVNSEKILLKHGQGVNYITIPRQLRTGYYYIRAYTNYMKNFGPGSFFMQRIKVVNPFFEISYANNGLSTDTGELKPGVSAEGGKMLLGIKNKIGFYSSNPVRILARLYKNDSVIAESETKDGFGNFVFIPDTISDYRIEAVTPGSKKTVVKIANFARSGVICRLDSVKKHRAYLKVISSNYDKFPLSVYVRNNGILYAYDEKLDRTDTSLEMNLPDGLNNVVVRNSEDKVVTSRMVYIKHSTGIEISAAVDQPEASSGDSVFIRISSNSKDSILFLVSLNLGDSITIPGLSGSIESSLFAASLATMTNTFDASELSDIYSRIKNINDYLLKFQSDEKTGSVLNKITFLPETDNDIITGSISSADRHDTIAGKTIYQAFVDSVSCVNHNKTDKLGRFVFALPLQNEGSELVLTVVDTTGNYRIKLDDEFYPNFLKINKEDYYPDSSLREVIKARMLNLQVDDAYSGLQEHGTVSGKRLPFYGYPDAEYQFRKYINMPDLGDFVFEIVKEATIIKKGKYMDINMLSSFGPDGTKLHPLIILDGIPLLKTDNVARIPTRDLKTLRILSTRFYFGTEVYSGVVDITSNTGSFDLTEMDKNSLRSLFSPVFSSSENYLVDDPQVPRYISGLYFNKMYTASGNLMIRLKLPDNKGNYSLSIFGITDGGEWGTFTKPNVLSINH